MMFKSEIEDLGRVQLPGFSGTRVQMMPFLVHDVSSLPEDLAPWRNLIASICAYAGERGVGFVTLDEAELTKGEHHRRPGLHVDCGGPLLAHGGAPPPIPPKHGGAPAPSPSPHAGAALHGGMYVVASSVGSRGWAGEFDGEQGAEGDCSHLAELLGPAKELEANQLYWCNHMFIHETLPARTSGPRQFLRVSMPSDAPWHSDYTPNPLGIKPTGCIIGPRATEMGFRP